MNAKVEDWGESHLGVQLALGPDEIDALIENLRVLRKDTETHFHISAAGPETPRLGDIEVSCIVPGQAHNMRIMSVALAPGTEVRDPRATPSRLTVAPIRVLAIWVLWLAGLYAGYAAVFHAYATFATSDYGPILIHGVWMSGLALLVLHCATALSRTWKARLPGLIGAALVLAVMSQLLDRLSAYHHAGR